MGVLTDPGAVRAAELPISVGQQALWMLHRLAPGSAAYNDAGAARFSPSPNISALTEAVQIVTERHDLLRSRFVEDDGMPVRLVDATGPGLRVDDVGDIDDRQLADLVATVAGEPYDLARGTARFRLLRRAAGDAVLVCGNHHIASDAASQFVLWRDLLTAYQARSAGRRPDLPALTWTWNDQVAAERRKLAGPQRASWTSYWRTVGRQVPAGELPSDRPRPARPAYQGGTVTVEVPATLERAVQDRAMALGVTPFAVQLAALQALIHATGGARDFLIGCPMSLRRSRPTLPAIGYYVNMVLLRATVDPGGSAADLVQAAARELRAAAAAAALPYPHIVRALDRGRDAGPPYRIAITQVDARLAFGPDRFDGVVHPFEVPRLQGQYDLGVEIARGQHSSEIAFRYDRELFAESTIRRYLGAYLRILAAAAHEPGTPIGRLDAVVEPPIVRI